MCSPFVVSASCLIRFGFASRRGCRGFLASCRYLCCRLCLCCCGVSLFVSVSVLVLSFTPRFLVLVFVLVVVIFSFGGRDFSFVVVRPLCRTRARPSLASVRDV